MNHFEFRDGVLHAEDVAIPDIAKAVGTPFYCYSTATLKRHFTRVPRCLRRARHARLLRHEGQLQPGRDRDAGAARRRRRRRLGGRAAPGAGGRRSGRSDRLLRRRQDAARDGLRAVGRHPLLQRRIRTGTGAAVAARRRGGQDGADLAAHQSRMSTPRPTRRSPPARPRTSSASPGSAPARSMPAQPRLPGIHVDRHRHAYRQPDHRAAALRRRLRAARRTRGDAARGRPPIEHVDLGGGLGIPYQQDNEPAAPARRLCRDRAQARRRISASSSCSSRAG